MPAIVETAIVSFLAGESQLPRAILLNAAPGRVCGAKIRGKLIVVTAADSPRSDQELYDQLAFYTLELRDPEFIHQHVVDAYGVQHAGSESKPIGIVFGLIGLYLHLEKNFTGQQVQRAHMQLARRRRAWTAPRIPGQQTAAIRIADVVAAAPGPERNAMIRRWCEAVWQDWQHARPMIAALARDLLGVEDHRQ
jgi:Family of unknown function (DUF5946)